MIDRSTLRELEELFHQAVALNRTDREFFLDRACENRPVVREQVERMIEVDSKANGSLDPNTPGDMVSIGRWKLIEAIGAGGLGVVYRASCECDGVTLHAAVKILRPELDTLLRERFVQERSMLAGLDHPYIARLIDAGAGPCGTSFLAMEFVEGLPLDEYLEQRKPGLKDRLELFNKICEAAAYLHDNCIVHGDLKPSNVMVRPDGTPKLLDFGTARLINRSQVTNGLLTQSMMTPAYASPEQIAGLGPSVRGDVYSLGCILREMIGHETDRDLAAIRDKCLARSAEARYASPLDIHGDVERHLKHLPISARPASSFWIVRKFIRRNRIACGFAALAVVALLAGWLTSRHNAMRARVLAEQRLSVVTRLVRDESVQRGPESRQRAAYAASVEDAAIQMEGMQPPPLSDLASAWRRVSYSQATRGQTPESIESIERSIRWGRRYVESSDTTAARAQLAESLLYATLLHQRRNKLAEAGRYAIEAVQLVDTLAPSSRAAIEKTPLLVRALPLAARRRAVAGDVAGGRALLMRAVELGRAMGRTMHLRATLDAVRFERAAKDSSRVNAWCAEAQSLEVKTLALARLCGAGADSAETDPEPVLLQEASTLENRLLKDPEKFGDRLRLARLDLQLARIARGKGDLMRARERIRQARGLTEGLIKADTENRNLHQLLAAIDRVSTRIQNRGAGPMASARMPKDSGTR